MGSSLTGQKINQTYDALLKVSDNGALDGTLQTITDGLGNDSALSLSTAGASVGGTLAVSGNAAFDTNTLFVDAANNRVGINTTPAAPLHIIGESLIEGRVQISSATPQVLFSVPSGGLDSRIHNDGSGNFIFGTGTNSDTPTERMRILSSGGLTFNGDTSAANALDDYEEGTWTIGLTFGGASVGITSSGNTGTYTKIGRQVTVNGILSLTSKGSSTGIAEITGLPFTIAAGGSNFCVASLWLNNVSFANQFVGRAIPSTNSFRIEEFSEAGTLSNIDNANFANNSEVLLSLTYFV